MYSMSMIDDKSTSVKSNNKAYFLAACRDKKSQKLTANTQGLPFDRCAPLGGCDIYCFEEKK